MVPEAILEKLEPMLVSVHFLRTAYLLLIGGWYRWAGRN